MLRPRKLPSCAARHLGAGFGGSRPVQCHGVCGQRTHELGIRVALGLPGRAVVGRVLREALVLALPGRVAGVTAAMAGARLVSSKVDLPLDLAGPSVFAWATLVLIVVTLLAGYVPARRATKVDPMTARRAE